MQTKKGDRYSVYLDGDFSFSLNEDLVIERKLRVGTQLSGTDVEEMVFADVYKQLLNKLALFLSYRMRSEKEIRDRIKRYIRLQKNKIPLNYTKLEDKLIFYLKDNKLIDDKGFAEEYVKQKLSSKKGYGPNYISNALRQKGINRDVIDSQLKEFDSEQQIDKALVVAKRKIKQFEAKSSNVFELKQRLTRYLQGRGYNYDAINAVVDTLCKVP